MNPFEMVVWIIAIIAVIAVLRARYGTAWTPGQRMRRRDGWHHEEQAEDPEKEMLRAEVQELKERVAVLERIATDSGTSLAHEIEKLRDR